MLNVFPDHGPDGTRVAPHAAAWIDLLEPTADEIEEVARDAELRVPGLAELSEIESSSRLSRRGGTLSMNAPAVQAGDGPARTTPVGFVLSRERLLTVRFAPLPAFDAFVEACRGEPERRTSTDLFLGLLEMLVDRLADLLEKVGDDLDQVSQRIFHREHRRRLPPRREEGQLRGVLRSVGGAGDLISKIRDMLLGFGRMVPFVLANADWLEEAEQARLETLRSDIASLADYDAHLTNKVQFLLDATLGFISIEQANIIKVLTVVSVVGVPPTFFASMYGMNFKFMPELDWAFGYPYALVLIVLSAVLPLLWFRRNGWL